MTDLQAALTAAKNQPATRLTHRELAHLATAATEHAATCECPAHPGRHPEHGQGDTPAAVLHQLAVLALDTRSA